ncbi:MAG: PIN domain-containing protein [Nanoarchaeota archaeon]
MVRTLFFDSYAFFEIIEGNENYSKYTKDIAIITTKLNLMELHYGLLSKYGKDYADKYYDSLVQFTVEISDEIIKNANEFRNSFKKRDLSYVDCIGYTLAQSLSIKFLTGDRQFEDMDHVEFVK